MSASTKQQALLLLRQALQNPNADFREGQWEAIESIIADKARLLVVQRTGWGFAEDIYEAVRPFILAELHHQPRDAKSLAADLNLRPGQLEDWLNRAVAEGKVEKTKKPVRYVINQSVTQSVTQLSLMD
ncbi:MAG: hypothetical protein Fur0025_18540 [Oscillatoriaceae cyanobacterium]